MSDRGRKREPTYSFVAEAFQSSEVRGSLVGHHGSLSPPWPSERISEQVIRHQTTVPRPCQVLAPRGAPVSPLAEGACPTNLHAVCSRLRRSLEPTWHLGKRSPAPAQPRKRAMATGGQEGSVTPGPTVPSSTGSSSCSPKGPGLPAPWENPGGLGGQLSGPGPAQSPDMKCQRTREACTRRSPERHELVL